MLYLISTEEAAKHLGISARRIRTLLQQGRVRGATKIGRQWLIPVPVEVQPPSPTTNQSVGVGLDVKRAGGEEVVTVVEEVEPGRLASLLKLQTSTT